MENWSSEKINYSSFFSIEELFGMLRAKFLPSRMKIKQTIAVNVDITKIMIFYPSVLGTVTSCTERVK